MGVTIFYCKMYYRSIVFLISGKMDKNNLRRTGKKQEYKVFFDLIGE